MHPNALNTTFPEAQSRKGPITFGQQIIYFIGSSIFINSIYVFVISIIITTIVLLLILITIAVIIVIAMVISPQNPQP